MQQKSDISLQKLISRSYSCWFERN